MLLGEGDTRKSGLCLIAQKSISSEVGVFVPKVLYAFGIFSFYISNADAKKKKNPNQREETQMNTSKQGLGPGHFFAVGAVLHTQDAL